MRTARGVDIDEEVRQGRWSGGSMGTEAALGWGEGVGVSAMLGSGERWGERWDSADGLRRTGACPSLVVRLLVPCCVFCVYARHSYLVSLYLHPAVAPQGGGGDDDDAFGDFEDMETGEVVTGAAAAAALGKASKGDEVAAAAQKAIKEAEREELRLKKAAQKAAFDASVSAGREGGRSRVCVPRAGVGVAWRCVDRV